MISAFPPSDPTEEEWSRLQGNFSDFLNAVVPIIETIPAASNPDGIALYMNDSRSLEPQQHFESFIEIISAFSENSTGLADFLRSSNFSDMAIDLVFDGVEAAMIIQNEFTQQTTTTTQAPTTQTPREEAESNVRAILQNTFYLGMDTEDQAAIDAAREEILSNLELIYNFDLIYAQQLYDSDCTAFFNLSCSCLIIFNFSL